METVVSFVFLYFRTYSGVCYFSVCVHMLRGFGCRANRRRHFVCVFSLFGFVCQPPDAQKGGQWKHIGNKTECALLGFVVDLGGGETFETIRAEVTEDQLHKVYTFNSLRKSMSTVIALRGDAASRGYRMFTKGASEIILQK